MSIQAALLYSTVTVAGAEDSVGKFRRVSDAADAAQGRLNRFSGASAQVSRGVGQIAGGMVRVAEKAAVAAGLAVAAAAGVAISFEDAFANVEKTVEDTPAALGKIDKALRQLSTTIPVTFQGLTSIAAEAGALGVATKDIVRFTEAVARTSAATVGLDPFAASEAFGKLSTIFTLTGDRIDATTGKMVSDYERLGSALVALGNAGASSEAEIIEVTKFFAGAGQAAGLSTAQVLAWGSAVASLGVEPEAGGGALQRVFQRLQTNLGVGPSDPKGWAKVTEWARVAGLSVKDFAKLYAVDASGAVIKFLEGLGKLDKFAAASTLKKAGIINQRDIRAVILLSQNLPVLTNQLKISTTAWDENVALQEVSEKRFATLKSKIIEFKNAVLVGAAAVGDGFTPALGRLVAKAKDFLNLHMEDLGQLGRDIGRGIDDINWQTIADGARGFVDVLKAGVDLIKQIPPQITLAVAGFLGLNKVSGGLIGTGVGNIVGGLGKGIANVILNSVSKVPVVGGVVGALTATRVFVVNFPPGFGVPTPGGPTPVVKPPGIIPPLAPALLMASLPFLLAGDTPMSANDKEKADELARKIAEYSKRDPSAFFSSDASVDKRTNAQVIADLQRQLDELNSHAGDAEKTNNAVLNAINAATVQTGHGDDLIAVRLSAIATAVNATAANTATMASIRVAGKVKSVRALDELGEAEDPFGFKHLKAFAMGKISSPGRMIPELERHIGIIDGLIAKAAAKGDTKTVAKLQETKAGLAAILRDVKAGTFVAGQKAYDGALLAAAAADRTTAAVLGLPAALNGVLNRPGPYGTGPGGPAPDEGIARIPTAPLRGSGVSPNFLNGGKVIPLAKGAIVKRRAGGTLAQIGEGDSDEAVIPLDGPGGLRFDLHPAPVRLFLDSREISRAQARQQSFTRRKVG